MALSDMSNIAPTHDIDDIDVVETVMRYHERTKHRFNRYAAGPRQLDWANQPNPFRRYEGAPLIHLPLLGAREAPLSPRYDDLYRRGSVPSADAHDPLAVAPACSTRWPFPPGSKPAPRAGRCAAIRRAATCIRPRATC